MSIVRKIAAGSTSSAASFFLGSLTLGLALALYAATMSDSTTAPAQADAIAMPPIVRAEPAISLSPSSAPAVVHVAPAALTKPVAAPAPASGHRARVSQLQKALTRAGCYHGPISGIWSDASKDAMRGFAMAANAQLPVDTPDDALVALVESNETATCGPARAIATGTLATDTPPTAEDRNMLDQPWARAGMLTTAREDAAPPTHPSLARNAIQSKDDKVLNVGSPIGAALAASPADPAEPAFAPQKPKKAKTAKRNTSAYDDVETSISKGFNSLQRSLSSMF